VLALRAWVAKSSASLREEATMSRVAKKSIPVPSGVEVKLDGERVVVKGPLGTLSRTINRTVAVENQDGSLNFGAKDSSRFAHAMSGTMRAIVANMVQGVVKGFEKKLTLVGVGYRAQATGDTLNLTLGFSHPVVHKMPAGIKVETPSQTEIVIKGVDKQLVGQVAADVREYRPPEPYKGKGVRYADEVVILKETKKK
jgi:large subunit ribosomal protein L6